MATFSKPDFMRSFNAVAAETTAVKKA